MIVRTGFSIFFSAFGIVFRQWKRALLLTLPWLALLMGLNYVMVQGDSLQNSVVTDLEEVIITSVEWAMLPFIAVFWHRTALPDHIHTPVSAAMLLRYLLTALAISLIMLAIMVSIIMAAAWLAPLWLPHELYIAMKIDFWSPIFRGSNLSPLSRITFWTGALGGFLLWVTWLYFIMRLSLVLPQVALTGRGFGDLRILSRTEPIRGAIWMVSLAFTLVSAVLLFLGMATIMAVLLSPGLPFKYGYMAFAAIFSSYSIITMLFGAAMVTEIYRRVTITDTQPPNCL